MCCRSIFHSSRYVNRVAVDADGPLGVTLFAHHNVATINSDSKSRHDAEQPFVRPLLPLNRIEYRVDSLENGVSFYCCGPTPQSNRRLCRGRFRPHDR